MGRQILVMFGVTALFVVIVLFAMVPREGPINYFEFLPGVEGKFADYTPIQITYRASVAPYVIASDLGNIDNAGDFTFSGEDLDKLKTNGFFAKNSRYKEMYEVYNEMKERNIPIFVTTDSLLHAYHILYDYVLREVEHTKFVDSLLDLTDYLAKASKNQYSSVEDSTLKEAARLNVAYFSVAGRLLDPSFAIPNYVKDEVMSELNLISAHEGFVLSPIFGIDEDYSQYVPRGHYTRSEKLESYFKAMMWYGRMTFTLRMSNTAEDIEIGRRQTRQALLIISALSSGKVDGEPAIEAWGNIYEPTAFFVGETDDLNLYDYSNLSQEVFGSQVETGDLASNSKIDEFIMKALELRRPQISSTGSLSNMQGFRFMGQRFIPDSYMFQELVYRKTDRMMPKGLDVMAVLGSDRAWEHLRDEWNASNYQEQMTKLKKEFSEVELEEWTQNLYWLWLHTLQPLLTEKTGEYPSFMLSEAWADKELVAALGSWTELRHDTILYAKQSYTELTAVPTTPKLVKGYVEPNPELYGRLASLSRMTREGLKSRGILSDEFESRLVTMEELSTMLMEISAKELEEKTLTNEEYETIWNVGQTLEAIITVPAEMAEMTTDADTKMSVVADVHTDPNSGVVLEEGTGYPMLIYVVARIEGKLFITAGASFSYYEFTEPISNRLTDEAWQEMLESGQAPEMPVWSGSYVS